MLSSVQHNTVQPKREGPIKCKRIGQITLLFPWLVNLGEKQEQTYFEKSG